MTKLTAADVAHLKAGDVVTLRKGEMLISNATLDSCAGGKGLSVRGIGLAIRTSDGEPCGGITEIVEPKPSARPAWPVGQRLTDGTVRAIKTNASRTNRWCVYDDPTNDGSRYMWITDDDVAGWAPVHDNRTPRDFIDVIAILLAEQGGKRKWDDLDFLTKDLYRVAAFDEIGRLGTRPNPIDVDDLAQLIDADLDDWLAGLDCDRPRGDVIRESITDWCSTNGHPTMGEE